MVFYRKKLQPFSGQREIYDKNEVLIMANTKRTEMKSMKEQRKDRLWIMRLREMNFGRFLARDCFYRYCCCYCTIGLFITWYSRSDRHKFNKCMRSTCSTYGIGGKPAIS